MSMHLLSIHVGHTANTPNLLEYVNNMNRVQQGISNLFGTIGLTSRLVLLRRVDDKNHEWIDVNLENDRQMDFFSVLEGSIDSQLTQLKLDHHRALSHAKHSSQLLDKLCVHRTWPASKLLDVLECRQDATHLSKFTSELDSGDGTIRFLFEDGQTTQSKVPNRRFSALWDKSVELTFCPKMAGPDGAILYLTQDCAALIGARSREIYAKWADPFVDDFSNRLQIAANAYSWVSGSCLVVTNGTGVPKGLLVKTLECIPNAA
jgi:hypothetical protein